MSNNRPTGTFEWGQIVGRAGRMATSSTVWRSDPAAVLAEDQMPPPAGLRIEVLENPDRIPEDTKDTMHLVLPAKPSAAELSEEEWCTGPSGNRVARCGCGGCHGCRGCGGCDSCWACVWCYNSPEPVQSHFNDTSLTRKQEGICAVNLRSAVRLVYLDITRFCLRRSVGQA